MNFPSPKDWEFVAGLVNTLTQHGLVLSDDVWQRREELDRLSLDVHTAITVLHDAKRSIDRIARETQQTLDARCQHEWQSQPSRFYDYTTKYCPKCGNWR